MNLTIIVEEKLSDGRLVSLTRMLDPMQVETSDLPLAQKAVEEMIREVRAAVHYAAQKVGE